MVHYKILIFILHTDGDMKYRMFKESSTLLQGMLNILTIDDIILFSPLFKVLLIKIVIILNIIALIS